MKCNHARIPVEQCGCTYQHVDEKLEHTHWCGDHFLSESVSLLPCKICESDRHQEALAALAKFRKMGYRI